MPGRLLAGGSEVAPLRLAHRAPPWRSPWPSSRRRAIATRAPGGSLRRRRLSAATIVPRSVASVVAGASVIVREPSPRSRATWRPGPLSWRRHGRPVSSVVLCRPPPRGAPPRVRRRHAARTRGAVMPWVNASWWSMRSWRMTGRHDLVQLERPCASSFSQGWTRALFSTTAAGFSARRATSNGADGEPLSAVAGRHGQVGFASRNPCRVHRVGRRIDHGPNAGTLWASLLMAPASAARRRRLTRRGPRSRPRPRAGAIRLGRGRRSVSACRGSTDGHALRHRGCHGFAPDGFMPATLPRPDRPGATRPGPRRRTRSGWGDVADGRRSCGRVRRRCAKAVFGPGEPAHKGARSAGGRPGRLPPAAVRPPGMTVVPDGALGNAAGLTLTRPGGAAERGTLDGRVRRQPGTGPCHSDSDLARAARAAARSQRPWPRRSDGRCRASSG